MTPQEPSPARGRGQGEGRIALRCLPPLLLLGACATAPAAPDLCGYTWVQRRDPATLVTVEVDPDTRRWPPGCNELGTLGCASLSLLAGGTWHAHIRLREPPDGAGPCSTVRHEFEHALGRDHLEKYQYLPRDTTR